MFWFRNLSPYRFTEPCPDFLNDLDKHLEQHRLGDCPSQETEVCGWAPPLLEQDDNTLLLPHQDMAMLSLGRKQRLLPAAVVNDITTERCREIALAESRQVGAKEKRDIKENVTQELLPRAFIRRSRFSLIVAPQQQALWVDQSNAKRCDTATSLLRQSAGQLPIIPLTPSTSASMTMTQWLLQPQQLPDGWELGDSAVLQDEKDGGTVRLRNQLLDSDEVRQHLSAGKTVQQLGIVWQERLSFQLDQDLVLRSIRYQDTLLDQLDDDLEDVYSVANAELALMRGEFISLHQQLCEIFC